MEKAVAVPKILRVPYQWIENMGDVVIGGVKELGRVSSFFISSLSWQFRPPFRYEEIFKQIEFVGNKSVFIICLCSLFTGMVFALQTYTAFHLVNADTMIGPTVALTLTRELGPVLTGLIVTGRAGAAMSAQLGTMRVTEQIDALEVMGVNPKQYLVMPRIIAGVVAMPLLAAIFDFVGNLGAYMLAVKVFQIDAAIYLAKINLFTQPKDIFQGLIKASVFGFTFALIGTYKGFNTTNGARGVGRATNETVVLSSIFILVSDYFLSAIIKILLY
ncbi:MAG: ABC transporter permease [Oligoflexia bacterium]|nr:ABC transporter permease [Oligoflexia bacterium]